MLNRILKLIKYIALSAVIAVPALSISGNVSYRGILEALNTSFAGNTAPVSSANEPSYRPGDWEKYIVSPQSANYARTSNGSIFSYGDSSGFSSYGSMNLKMSYGGSFFTDSKYRNSDTDRASSSLVSQGFSLSQELKVHMEGRIGERLKVYVDHDSGREDNRYLINYKAAREDELLREINAGEIDLKFGSSKYAVYDDNSAKGLGVDFTVRKGDFRLRAFGSIKEGETVTETFTGSSTQHSVSLKEYQYEKLRYYQLEPFKRYDGLTSVPAASSALYESLNTFTSAATSFSPNNVGIDPSGFALYMDDQNSLNDSGAITLELDGGKYTLLVSGTDYTINHSTGLITFLSSVPAKSRIFAVYNLLSGSTTDPSARTDIYPGRNFVFIKYGYSIDEDSNRDFALASSEDRNGDGKLNLDIYEVRSAYYLGYRQIEQDNFTISFLRENSLLTKDNADRAGKYSIDYENGILFFNKREPFRELLTDDQTDRIYAESTDSSAATSSRISIKADYMHNSRNYQLKYSNLLEGSVKIKVDERTVASSLYSVDYTSGYIAFNDENNPFISPESKVEIKYEYLPAGAQSSDFIGGARADYDLSRDITLGGTVLFSGSTGGGTIPDISSSPDQTMVLEGDISLDLSGRRLADLAEGVTGSKVGTVPARIRAYGEIARSYRKVNSFGKALIDSMESSGEITAISLSEKDWILSSMPWQNGTAEPQSARGILNYLYYRNPSSPGTLRGLSFTPYSVDYSVKPGPYNVAAGHIESSIQEQSSQRSLVLDYDFTSGNTVAIATRKLSSDALDFSSIQYIEFTYRLDGASSDSVNLFIDVGTINEDSDGDGILDTEDSNLNGVLDSDPSRNYSEDSGYSFNGNTPTFIGSGPGLSSSTSGDGILTSEDLNGNGYLDTSGYFMTFPGASSAESLFTVTQTSEWKTGRIYIDSSSFTDSDTEKLKTATAVRMYLRRNSGSSGRLYIDSLKFVSSNWVNPSLDGSQVVGPDQLSLSFVNTLTDADYRAASFVRSESSAYKSLYGDLSEDELDHESESSLQLSYNISGGDEVTVTRRFSKTIDLRHYKTLNIWLNPRSYQQGNEFRVYLGSSDNDFIEYHSEISERDYWKNLALVLQEGSTGTVKPFSTTGNPDMKRISWIKIGIYGPGSSGKLWVNEIYTSEAETIADTAHWIETDLSFTKPLYVTDGGTPVMSDLSLKFLSRGHGSGFSSVGKENNELSEATGGFYSSATIVPGWKAVFDFTREKSSTDALNDMVAETLRGRTVINTISTSTSYTPADSIIPGIHLSYRGESLENRRTKDISGISVDSATETEKHVPELLITDSFSNFLWGKLETKFNLGMVLKNNSVKNNSTETDEASLSLITAPQESEKRERTETSLILDYSTSCFYIRPHLSLTSEEIVELTGSTYSTDTSVLNDVSGGYHLPFQYGSDMRFVERTNRLQFAAGIMDTWLIAPRYDTVLSYSENGFSDYDDSNLSKSGSFRREKDGRSIVDTGITIPFSTQRLSGTSLAFIKNLNLAYNRSITLYETSAPYEGEGTDYFDEQYGISRSLAGLMNEGMNIFNYYPGYFLGGGGHSERTREYINSRFNSGISFPDGSAVSDYENQLKLIESFSLSWLMEFASFNNSTTAGINQVTERLTINSLPQQVISWEISTQFNFDMMKLFRFGFFRPNSPESPRHDSSFDIGYSLRNNMLITQNIYEHTHSPLIGVTFKWDRSYISISGGVELRNRSYSEYISQNDELYFSNISTSAELGEFDAGYTFSTVYETDVKWLHRFFEQFHALTALPIFTLEYRMAFNRYDYDISASPEPYDMFLLNAKLTLDLHRHIQGGISATFALEQYRNRDTEAITSRIVSYEGAASLTLLF